MKTIAKYLVNIIAFIALMYLSIKTLRFLSFTKEETDTFLTYTEVLHIHDSELAYGMFFVCLHTMLALVILCVFRFAIKQLKT